MSLYCFDSICGHDHLHAVPSYHAAPSSPRCPILPRRPILLTPPHYLRAAPSVHGYKTTQSAR